MTIAHLILRRGAAATAARWNRLAGADRSQLLAFAAGDSGDVLAEARMDEECRYTWRSLLACGWHRDPMPVPIRQPAQLVNNLTHNTIPTTPSRARLMQCSLSVTCCMGI